MTACTNHGGKARRVVTAALVGVLSVGTVPMVALAEGVNDAVSPMFATGGIDGSEFVEGEIDLEFSPAFTDGDVNVETDEDGYKTVTADQIPFRVEAKSVTPAGTNKEIDVTPGNDFKVALYKADEDGNPTGSPLSGNRVLAAGDYVITVTPLTGADYVGQTFTEVFKVVPVQIEANKPYENGDEDDTTLRFTGSALDLDFKMDDGTKLVEGKDYTVKYTNVADGKTTDAIVDAGTYTATLSGLGIYEGTSSTSEKFEVIAFGLANPATTPGSHIVVAAYGDKLPDHPERVYWESSTPGDDTELDSSIVNIVNDGAGDITESGKHTVAIKVDQDQIDKGNVNYDNSNPIHVDVVKYDVEAQLTYNGSALQDSYDVFPGQKFDVNAVKASYNGTELTADGVTVVDDYNATTVPGEYEVTFTYNANGNAETSANDAIDGKVFAVTKTVTVRVWDGKLDADTQLWVYGPEYNPSDGSGSAVAINSYSKAYDGTSLKAGDFYVTDKGKDATTLTGELVATLYDSEGNEVDEAINAGEYTLKVTSERYKLSGTTELKVTIHKVDLASTEVGELELWNDVAGEEYLPLVYVFVDDNDDGKPDKVVVDAYKCSTNGLAISELGLVYNTGNDGLLYSDKDFDPDDDGYDFKGQDLLPDNVDVVVEYNDGGTWKPVANIDKPGQFRVSLTVGEDVAANYTATSKTLEFTVAYKTRFSDVQPSDWYYDAVTDVDALGYMGGYGSTGTFGAEDELTRAQAVIVLYNMSGANFKSDTAASYDETKGWVTGFSDVDGHAYYAEAVAWAKSNGVVNGNGGKFMPEDEITREQFAAMLFNYAERINRDETVDDVDGSALAALPDAGTVSDWAESAVAWAVDNGIMGNNGSVMAQSTITRGEVAAMAVNYQPVNRDGVDVR